VQAQDTHEDHIQGEIEEMIGTMEEGIEVRLHATIQALIMSLTPHLCLQITQEKDLLRLFVMSVAIDTQNHHHLEMENTIAAGEDKLRRLVELSEIVEMRMYEDVVIG